MKKEFGLSICVFAATGKPSYLTIDEHYDNFEQALVAKNRFTTLFSKPEEISVDIRPLYRDK